MNYREFLADRDRSCSIVAHRGVWRDAPENSLRAIEAAITAGYDVVEIDVRRSADGEFVLLHDDTLERMAGDERAPEALTGQELAGIALRNRDGGPDNDFTDQTVPLLRDVFALTRGRIFIHLDIKHRELIGDVIALAQAAGVDQQVDVWADIGSDADVDWVESVVKPAKVAFVARTRLEQESGLQQVEHMLKTRPDVCELSFGDLRQVTALRERLAAAGIPLWVNTLNSVASPGFTDSAALESPDLVWGRLIEAGFSSIQTDEMAALRTFVVSHGTQ